MTVPVLQTADTESHGDDDLSTDLRTILRVGRVRAGAEIRQLVRARGLLIFTFLTPVVMLTLLGMIFRGTIPGTTVKYQEIYATGMLGMCVVNACLQLLPECIFVRFPGNAQLSSDAECRTRGGARSPAR